MSMTTPPGWYPDPAAPGTERWWDGASWTAHTRAAGTPGTPVAAPTGQPPTVVPSGEASGRAKAVALGAAGLVLVASIVTGAVVLGRDGDGSADTRGPGPSASADDTPSDPETTTGSPTPTTAAPTGAGDVLNDQLSGISLPLLDGWKQDDRPVDRVATAVVKDSYTCPGTAGFCYPGRVTSRTTAVDSGESARNVAEKDIAEAAKREYDRDAIGRRPYNGLSGHRQVDAGRVEVAGAEGYFVRWKVTTNSGPGGYVQSLAFPAPSSAGSMVVVRYAFDAGPDGPPLSAMDKITKGIRATR